MSTSQRLTIKLVGSAENNFEVNEKDNRVAWPELGAAVRLRLLFLIYFQDALQKPIMHDKINHIDNLAHGFLVAW